MWSAPIEPQQIFKIHAERSQKLDQHGYVGALYEYVVTLGHGANVERITVEFTLDLGSIWPVVFQLQV